MNRLVRIFVFLLETWHRHIAPFLPRACRHEPTCSIYMAGALKKYGFFKGMKLGIGRLLRCHPFGSHGYDPVP